jgi:aspartyl aminopeptidase
VGSGTKQGADSTFLPDVFARIKSGLKIEEDVWHCMLADSFLISADNAHALHPNHPEKADPENRPFLNGGIVIKYHGSQRYASDAYSSAVMKKLCEKAKVPCQTYANRSDMLGGSTLGNILMAQVSVNTVDIGLPQLAMHSSYETAGAKDLASLICVLECFYGG